MGKIVGLDIGSKHNGVAILDNETGELLHVEICTGERLIACVERLKKKEVDAVGIEKFVLYPWAAESQTWNSFENIELIGAVKYILSKADIPVVEPKAVDSKTLYGKARLKELGYIITSDPYDHKQDALSVALYTQYRLKRAVAATKKKKIRIRVKEHSDGE